MAGNPTWTLRQEKEIRTTLVNLDEDAKAIWIAFHSGLSFEEALEEAVNDRGGIET